MSIFVQTCQIESTNVNVWFTSVAVTKNSPDPVWGRENIGAGDRARTGTSVASRDFKACISSGRQRKYTELQVQDPLKINAFHRFLKKIGAI